MALILSKLFAEIMSVVVMLSGMFPALFGGKEYIDPYSSDVLVSSEISFADIEEPMAITDHETALKYFGFEENGELNERFFEVSNIVAIPVTIPNSICKVFVESISVNNDKVTVKYSVVRDGCIGATIMSSDIILIAVDKNVREVETTEKNITVPFCIHGVPFSFDV